MKLLKFSASWCAPCKQLSQVIESLNIQTEIQHVDIEDNSEMAAKFKVRAVPTLVLVEGDSELSRTMGAKTRDQLSSWLTTNKVN